MLEVGPAFQFTVSMHFSKPLTWLFAAWLTLAVTIGARPAGPVCNADPSNGARRAVYDMNEDSALVPSEFDSLEQVVPD